MVHRAELLHQEHFSAYYQHMPPPEALSRWVDHYWFLNTYEALGDDVSECYFPRLASEWVFTQASSDVHSPFQGIERLPLSRMTQFIYPRQTFALGVRFQPGVHFDFTQWSEVFQAQLQVAFTTVNKATAPAFFLQQVAHFNRYFTNSLFQNAPSAALRERLRVCQQALDAFEDPEQSCVHQVAAHLGVTPRTLRRYFQAVLFMSPKSAQRQVRLRQALRVRWGPGERHHDGLLNYYTDTSHFYKTFRQICDTSLQQFSARYTA